MTLTKPVVASPNTRNQHTAAMGNKIFDQVKSKIITIARLTESFAAMTQGKGYGAASIQHENKITHEILAKKPRLAMDIGANVGNYTAELRRRNPDLEIHAFEPSASNSKKLLDRFSRDPNIKIQPCAVSSENGTATLFSNKAGSTLGSLTQRKLDHFNIDFDVKEEVKKIRFEDYWTETLSSRQIDIAKIDIEGHELDALKGFGQALSATHLIQFEFGGCNIDTRTYFRDFWYFFKDCSFDLYRITPLGAQRIDQYRESDERFSTTNYIALNRKLSAPV